MKAPEEDFHRASLSAISAARPLGHPVRAARLSAAVKAFQDIGDASASFWNSGYSRERSGRRPGSDTAFCSEAAFATPLFGPVW